MRKGASDTLALRRSPHVFGAHDFSGWRPVDPCMRWELAILSDGDRSVRAGDGS